MKREKKKKKRISKRGIRVGKKKKVQLKEGRGEGGERNKEG